MQNICLCGHFAFEWEGNGRSMLMPEFGANGGAL
jgi:hypothetical protein